MKAENLRLKGRAVGRPPLQKVPLKGVTIDMESLQMEFFEIVGLDYPDGAPTGKKMQKLEIDSLFQNRTEPCLMSYISGESLNLLQQIISRGKGGGLGEANSSQITLKSENIPELDKTRTQMV